MNKPLRLLLVDGHPVVRDALCERLQRMSQVGELVASDSLAAATGFMRAFGPDVVLCDPRTLGGLDADAVHRLGDGGCPVVVLTSSLQAGEADDLRRAGAAAVLLKGCGMSDLLTVLDAVVAAHHGSRCDTEAPAPASTQR